MSADKPQLFGRLTLIPISPEYRAMLYSRLETQRNKRDDSNQRINEQQPLGEPKVGDKGPAFIIN